MRAFLTALFLCISVSWATGEVVQLPRIEVKQLKSDILLVGKVETYELPTPQFILGDVRVKSMQEGLAMFEKMDAAVVVTIDEIKPIAITMLKEWYDHTDPNAPLFWYRIHCSVKEVLHGVFPDTSIEFVATYGGERLYWQFVRGYAFCFGMEKRGDEWTVASFFRTSPLPPYRVEDHLSYYNMKGDNPDFDWSQSDAAITKAESQIGRRCRDAAIEKGQHFILTFDGDELWGGLNIDYGKSVTIVTNKWEYPFPGAVP